MSFLRTNDEVASLTKRTRNTLIFFLCTFLSFALAACSDLGRFAPQEESTVTTTVSTEATASDAVDTDMNTETQAKATTESETTEATTKATTEVTESPSFDYSKIPAYDGEPFVVVNDGVPFFTEDEKQEGTFENYSKLDRLGRCGVAFANLSKELMPTEARGEIGDIRPSGWHTVKYNDLIEGNYLYNRCHLIAYSLAGENSNEKNLITGTRYLNTEGMLPFENEVADYIGRTDNHVLYRVTPVFEGDDLVASGVLMEGWSVEDKGVCFNVFCYNVQPYIIIDYTTGESSVDEEALAKAGHSENPTEKATDGTTEVTTESTTQTTTETATEATTEVTKGQGDEPEGDPDFVVNTKSKKIHRPTCSSVDDMAEYNKWYYYGAIEELKEMGYEPCKRCLKGY